MRRKSNRVVVRILFKYLLPLLLQKIVRGGESIFNYFQPYKQKRKIFIKICAPNWRVANEWGDFHLALGLKKYFERKGYRTIIQCKSEWTTLGKKQDIAIMLRGLEQYIPNPNQWSILWMISHPNDISLSEIKSYNCVFVASSKYTEKLNKELEVKAMVLNQCTDTELFYPIINTVKNFELLFIGNSRNVFRQILKDILPTKFKLKVFGWGWSSFLENDLIGDTFIPNSRLNKYYNETSILLNDHWQDMKENGFISNRIFDGVASGALIVSDKVTMLDSLFTDSVYCYEEKEELKFLINDLLDKPRLKRSSIGENTFENRVDTFIKSFPKNN